MILIKFTVFFFFIWNFYDMKVLGFQEFVVHQGYENKKDFLNEWTVEIEGSPEIAELIALEFGYIYGGEVLGFPDTYIFRKDEHAIERRSQLHRQMKRLTNHVRVRWAEQLFDKSRVKREIDDPDRTLDRVKRRKLNTKSIQDGKNNTDIRHKRNVNDVPLFNDELWGHEWYLQDTRTNENLPRLDLNVLPVYRLGINGTGIRISILDDGLEHSHTDLKDNYDPEISWDCNDGDADPSPRYEERNLNSHGTRCAGEIAMTANNFKCGVGVAFGAKVGGIRMLDGRVTDRVEGEALGYAWDKVDIYSASWGPNDDGRTVEGPGRLASAAMLRGVTKGRGGKGTIYVWANGNGGSRRDNCNCDGYSSNMYTVSIASASQQGLFPWYGEVCASTLATAYSSGAYTDQKIATTDTGDTCTLRHTGTSAAAPLAAGIIALMLQANPTLTWRDVQHLIVWNSEHAPLAANDGWQINNAGLRFDIRFGFGLLNAHALVAAALNWTTVPEKRECTITSTQKNMSLSTGGRVEILFQADDCPINYIEHVELFVNIAYTRRGALQIYLASPRDTTVPLLSARPLDMSNVGFSNWPLTSVATWGENPHGLWKATFLDETKEYNNGIVGSTKLIIHGTKEIPDHMKNGPRSYESFSYNNDIQGLNSIEKLQEENIETNTETTKNEIENILELLAQPKQGHNNILADINPTIFVEIEKELLRIHHRMTKYSGD